ncbi:NAD(P)H-binding protein [Actinokineospora pegani]|uniref:NAD(P)H-binding protein n=1 Tax=Actinokineospora pegani TaxID=2654637 RepID=UPI0018D36CCE|nr:NAD(P)H-binding protein [Actinokineospora pegani]
MILTTGATGTVGSRVAAALAGHPTRAVSRTTTPRFDWTDRSTWGAVLDGVDAVFIVPLDGEALTGPFLRHCADQGVHRVVLLSGRGVDVPGYAPTDSGSGLTHTSGEKAVRASDREWTVLRPTWFAQNFTEGLFADALRAGDLRLPAGDGAAPFVDADDIAEVAAAVLTGDGHAGRTYELTGPRALTLAEVAGHFPGARYTPVPAAEYVADLVAQGWPRLDAEDMAATVTAIERGLDTPVSDGVRQVLGRAPRPFPAV